MDAIEHAIIEDFGNGYANFGHSEMLGRVVGFLLCALRPVAVEEISRELHVSKSPVNQICRRLEELHLIRKAWVKGARKFHYEIAPDVFLQASMNLSRLYDGNLSTAQRNLEKVLAAYEQAEGEEKQRLRFIANRLLLMRHFYQALIRSYRDFIEQWKRDRASVPVLQEGQSASAVPAR